MTVAAPSGISPYLYSVYKPEIPVVHSKCRQVSALVAVLTENGCVAALTGLCVRFGKDRVFGHPVKVVILGLYIDQINVAGVALVGSYIAGLGVEVAKVTRLFTGEKRFFRYFNHFFRA
jgi:hypothetical protein